MKVNSKTILIIIVTISFLWASLDIVFSDQEFTNKPMNASISQPICIEISGNYSIGVLFTNTTTIGTQYPITNMGVLNNATSNYWNNSATEYWIRACTGNTINSSVYHCACEDLTCSSGSCAVGTDRLYVSYTADGGVGWANGTNSSVNGVPDSPPSTSYYFAGTKAYQLVGLRLDPSGSYPGAYRYVYLKYWIDPRPNGVPSGVYNTTYKIRAVETGTSAGSCTC
jgi:hypothetical protein